MAVRAYIRTDPGLYERKALGILPDGTRVAAYPAAAFVAFMGCLGLAEEQPQRGRFKSERILRELLIGADGSGRPYARQLPYLFERGDLVRLADGRVYVDGWDHWQEGDVTVAERMRRLRHRKAGVTNGVTPHTVTGVTAASVTVPSDGDRHGSTTESGTDSRGGGRDRGISRGGGDAPSRASSRSMTDEERSGSIAANRRIIENPASRDEVVRAAIHAVVRLDPETDWMALREAALNKAAEVDWSVPGREPSTARPRRA